MKIKVKNNHASSVNRAGFTFGPDEVKKIDVNEEEKFRIQVVRYLEVKEIEEDIEKNTGEDDIGPEEENDSNTNSDLKTILDNLNVNQLQEIAKGFKITGYSRMKKKDLIDEILKEDADKIKDALPEE